VIKNLLSTYITACNGTRHRQVADFWIAYTTVLLSFNFDPTIAFNVVSALAGVAYVECVFSVCGIRGLWSVGISTQERETDRLSKNLSNRVFLSKYYTN